MNAPIYKFLTAALLGIVFFGLLSGCTTTRLQATIDLAKGGKAQCVIVGTPEEKEAAGELKTHLDKITGGNFTIVEEKDFAGDKPAIYLGETEFAKKHGIDFNAFAPEEWLVKTVDGSLIVGGSKMNGTLFGVYDLLENQLGCHWFTFDSTHIPHNPDLQLGSLDIRKQPSFAYRYITSNQHRVQSVIAAHVTPETSQAYASFDKRSRGHRNLRSPLSTSKQYRFCHNFHVFVSPEKYFKTHPEYFSMNEKGERFSTHPAQLCLSNPAVWEITLDSLRAFIKKDRETLPVDQWPVVYDISQMDSSAFICRCPECTKITEREGDESGLILTYINHVAREIAKEYPEIKIRTFAYTITENAPKALRPEPNVIIQWCDLYTRSDCYRPLTSSVNVRQKAQLAGWSAIGAHIAVWDYWNMGILTMPFFKPPRVETMVDAIAPDLRHFKETGVVSMFIEFETYPDSNPQNFADLQVWIGHQLLLDLDRDPEALIALFMDKHYGPAARPMTKFLNALHEAIRTEKASLFYVVNPARPNTLNKEFLAQAHQWLTEARDLTEPGSDYRKRVEKEMITPLAVMLLNPQFQIPGRDAMLALYRELRNSRIERYYPPDVQAKLKERLAQDLLDFEIVDIPTPPEFAQVPEKDLRKFAYTKFSKVYLKGDLHDFRVADPDSPVGKAMTAPPTREHDMKTPVNNMFPTRFGVHDPTTKKDIAFDIPKIPADEKYHWYKVGTFEVGPGTYVHGFFWLMKADISSVYGLADGVADFNKWEVWVSAKYTGPAYVKGSTKPNQIFWDQVILKRPGQCRQ